MSLIPVLETDGDILIHVYKRQGPVREFCDDYLRDSTTQMSPKECWRFSEAITKFAHSLSQSNIIITVPETLPLLGIQSGEYDLQSFFYEHIFKCFWNDQFSFDENVLVNFDWYHPLDAYRHTEQEVIEWFEAAGLVDVVSSYANVNGVSVRGKKK